MRAAVAKPAKVHRRWRWAGGALALLVLCGLCCLAALLLPPPAAGGAQAYSGVCIDPQGPGLRPMVSLVIVAWSLPSQPMATWKVGAVGGCVQVPYHFGFISAYGVYRGEWP